ncbi:MalY/PatB family protein [Spirochaeta africana]|uniref:cysteine-S-conjugate beta-lyase n=1 Tax=Spirochaeta africana (strain ATCC 700263 / DSM 8902 / Z-7692) TaxID=889378 RepID=H9UM49_SPIAZ|nr:PatB family C-S lyase [Spirochaeta africana]AFG38592.1 bifunctional PLP-dependent enzyme with beta-cystathionase and maltose regulon repressor activities [Spirochaeta africana DSM 8902]
MKELYSVPPRRGTNSLKWDLSRQPDVLPLWVADMDFTAPPAVLDALQQRVSHGVFGYTIPGESLFTAFEQWMYTRHGIDAPPAELMYVPGVMPMLRLALRLLVPAGGRVVVPEPVYYPFFSAVRDNDLELVAVPLTPDPGQRWEFDFDALELALQGADVLLLCSPQNPVGRVWTSGELSRVLGLADAAGVTVLADEIHQDILFPGSRFCSVWQVADEQGLGDLDERMISVTAPSKTFNIPGLPCGIARIRSAALRRRLSRALERRSLELPNLLALTAAEAAYREGGPWLDQVLAVIRENYTTLQGWATARGVRCARQDGTYVVWLDFRDSGLYWQRPGFARRLRKACGVWLSDGEDFTTLPGHLDADQAPVAFGRGFLRCNVATSPAILQDALDRIAAVLEATATEV